MTKIQDVELVSVYSELEEYEHCLIHSIPMKKLVCWYCDGQGVITTVNNDPWYYYSEDICPECGGTKMTWECRACEQDWEDEI